MWVQVLEEASVTGFGESGHSNIQKIVMILVKFNRNAEASAAVGWFGYNGVSHRKK